MIVSSDGYGCSEAGGTATDNQDVDSIIEGSHFVRLLRV